jgi:hypothetical protein
MSVNDVLAYYQKIVDDVWAYLSILPLISILAFSRSGMLRDRESPAFMRMAPVTFRRWGNDMLVIVSRHRLRD